ncbi:ArnT family glycosyltransferase [Hyphococcus luteus]|uniref:Glycosyltransferase RgtA/B/C/D-like domain-containing protein n=1 Tax=Hyphococcus luteus TaxID=2058213 RepID=A0A2S7K5Z5_9PROT|nr:glycosyltransferase family 39 protein [Marinicaulis flavus]PQA87912.1 hypothetical protein CW354_06080 [Marinicaulis flavus]
MTEPAFIAPHRSGLTLTGRIALPALALVLAAVAFLVPPMPFITDGAVYAEMAQAMAGHGWLHIAENGGVEGAPALQKWLTVVYDGKVYPQYPSGYALIAAPFYLAFGMRGLLLLNALASALALAMTFQLCRRLWNDRAVAFAASALLGGATYLSTYAFAIWPHALALVFYLGAALAAVEGAGAQGRERRLGWMAASGLFIGLGVNIRVDMILALPAVLLWLRLFVLPKERAAAAAVLVGTLPGLALSAWFNWMKFGRASPFSYGSDGGFTNASHYLAVALAAGLVLAGLLLVNLPGALQALRRRPKPALFGGAGLLLVLAALAWPLVWPTLRGLWVLVVDLQALQPKYFRNGVGYDAYGHLLFWNFPKRALLQSAPFFALAVIPVIGFFRGRNVGPCALCLLFAAAPIVFYAQNEWHGGGGYNMRYFTPALPFLSILTADGLVRLLRKADAPAARMRLFAFAAAAAGFTAFLFADEISRAHAALRAPLALYPQLILFALLAAAAARLALAAQTQKRASAGAAVFAFFVIGYGAGVSLLDTVATVKTRLGQQDMAAAIADAVPANALILSEWQTIDILAEDKGAAVMEVYDETREDAAEAADAFARAGRCVYFQGERVRDAMAGLLKERAVSTAPVRLASTRFSDDLRVDFYGLADQADRCALKSAPDGRAP